jgi:transposase
MSNPQTHACRRAELILQVQAGQITATEAAQQLGLSRKSYYQWEHRALEALVQSQEQLPPGRPRLESDPEKERLRQENQALKAQVTELEQILSLRQTVQQWQNSDAKKNARSWTKSSSKPPPPSPPPG